MVTSVRRLVCVALLSAGPWVLAQGVAPAASGPDVTIHARSMLVLVPALVRDGSGELVEGLKASDFRVTDNGVEQKVSLEPVPDAMEILVLMQTGGAAARQFANYRTLSTMVGYLAGRSKYEAAVVSFDSQPEDIWDFTSDARALEDAFVHPVAGDHGAAVLDAVTYGVALLAKTPAARRRVIVLLSQPQDDGSKAKPEEVVRALGENNVTIFSVTFSPEKAWVKDQLAGDRHENAPYQIGPDHPPLLHTFDLSTPLMMAVRAMRTDVSAEIAKLSGGEAARFDDRRSLDEQLAAVANHIANRYVLSFRPTSDRPGFHGLTVQARGPEGLLHVSSREGYWADSAHTQ